VPLFFLDTSALAKYYRRESGSDVIEQMFAHSGAQRVISRLALVEMESVFALKVRMGEINQQAALTLRQRLESDLGRRHILMAAVRDEHFQVAKLLIMKYGPDHGLRTLDALQLAVASGLQRAGFAPIFVAADQKLCQAAALEGLRVTNPEQPMSILI
jgi:predicted nucleic acid-binding protein